MNMPWRTGDRYLCFIVVREDKGWHGPYGQTRWWPILRCEECGYEIQCVAGSTWAWKRMTDHHECGHAPCAKCGQMLLRRKDGTPRQHAHNRCPAKSPGDKIEREFVKHMGRREYA